MQAQAKICPICIDDHGAERLCSYAEMRYRIEDLQASITEARAEIAAKDARIAELEAFATEQNRERTEAIGACQERIAQLEAENEALRAALTVERDATIQRAERAERVAVWAAKHEAEVLPAKMGLPSMLSWNGRVGVKFPIEYRQLPLTDTTDADIYRALREAMGEACDGGRDHG